MNRFKNYATWLMGLVLVLVVSEEVQAAGYCEGHSKKIIPFNSLNSVQNELNRYNAAEYNYNGRYEICLQIKNDDQTLELLSEQKLTINNVSGKEVVIGFLKAKRKEGQENTALPLLDIRGANVTLFSPAFSNVKKAVTMQGSGHKIIGGTITGIASAADSLCVSGNGNKTELKDVKITDCPNAISVDGDENIIDGVNVSFSHLSTMPQLAPESGVDETRNFINLFKLWYSQHDIADGTALLLKGNHDVLRSTTVSGHQGIGVQILGNDASVFGSQIQGEPIPEDFIGAGDSKGIGSSGLARRSTDCLLVKTSSNITLESNEISNCQQGVHIADSQQITIGPEQLKDFETKHNNLHNNDYAIHAQSSQQVFAWHNSIYGNGLSLPPEEAYHFGLWFDSTNFLETVLLKEPIFESVDKDLVGDVKEVPIVNYGASAPFAEVNVFTKNGWIELSFPQMQDRAEDAWRYQSYSPFSDCPFNNVTIGSNGYGKVICPLEITDNLINKRVIAIIHEDAAGSSPISETLGVINNPTGGILVSLPAPETGNMTAGASDGGGSGGKSGGDIGSLSVIGATSGASGGGGGKASSCNLNPSAQPGAFLIFWYLLPLLYFGVRKRIYHL